MKRILGWVVFGTVLCGMLIVLALALYFRTNRVVFAERTVLPTAMAGISTKDQDYQTPIVKRTRTATPRGPTSTPAPFATKLPPTPLPPPVAVPHSLQGRADCMYCHIDNTYFSVPADHKRRTNDMCLGCHPLDKSVARSTPRPVSHSAEGRENCLTCHFLGVNGAKPIPGSHAGRTNETCRSCHPIK